jgi:hypothetical protein
MIKNRKTLAIRIRSRKNGAFFTKVPSLANITNRGARSLAETQEVPLFSNNPSNPIPVSRPPSPEKQAPTRSLTIPSMKNLIVTTSLVLASISASHAAITYVDASASNLTLANGSAFSPSTSGNVYNDNNWSVRTGTGLASNNTIYEAGGSTNGSLVGETVPVIRQTLTGLTAGTYDVYAYFWTASNVRWGISAGLADNALTAVHGIGGTTLDSHTYSDSNATRVTVANLTDGSFSTGNAPTLAIGGSDRVLAQFYLGTATVDGTGNLNVFIGNQTILNTGASPSVTNSRTWFDGVGYEVIPEPSSALLGGLAFLGLLRRRRD